MISRIAALILILTISFVSAQDYPWNILLTHDDTLFNVSLEYFTGDYLLATTGAETYWISINSIIEMTKLRKSKAFEGMGYGILAGGAMGALIGLAAYEKPKGGFDLGPGVNALGGGISGGILGIAIGGVVGGLVGKDEVYDLSQSTYEEKVKLIKYKMWK
jgi:NADPH-dependent curcumin reductase CurA